VAEARELRAGGPVVVAQAVGVAADTVRQGRGRAELDDPVLPPVGVSHAGRDARRHGLGIRELAARHGVHRRTMSVSATAGCRYQNCSLGCGGLARSPQRLTRQVGRRIAEVCGQWRT
jgi:hypothetical protein